VSTGVNVRNRTRNAAGWALFSGAGQQLSQVVVAIALAGLLGPSRYGVVALGTIYIAFVDFVVRQGIVLALVQRKDLTDDHLDAGFWMSMGTAVVLGVGTILGAGWWADVMNAPKLESLLIALSGSCLFQSAWQIPKAINQRELDFKGSELPVNIGAVCGAAVGLTAAFLGAGEWAIVWQIYTYGLVGNALLYGSTGWKPRFRFSGRAARDLLGVSSGAFLATIGTFVSGYADAIVLGVFFGPLAVGLYRFAARFVAVLINLTQASLSRVMLAVLSRHQDDTAQFGRVLKRQLGSLLLAVLPGLGILFAIGRAAPLLLGEKWEASGPVLRILCLGGIARGMVLFANIVLLSRGHAHRSAATLWFNGAVKLGAATAAGLMLRDASAVHQIEGVAYALLAAQLLVVGPLLLSVTSHYSGVPVRGLLGAMSPPLMSAVAAIGAGTLVDEVARRVELDPWITVLVVGSVATAAAGVVLLWLSDPARRLLADARRKVRRGPRAAALVAPE
jgi:teichuronic acid exporter